MRVDLNADLGEITGDLALLSVVTSANVACGGHAGDDATMAEAVARATAMGVAVGAHPSYPDREGFGRTERRDPPEAVAADVAAQVARLASFGPVSYVKLHGALYHRANEEAELADAILDALAVTHVLAAPGVLLDRARERGLEGTEEGFCDRAYDGAGALVPRSVEGAVLRQPGEVALQAVRLARSGRFGSLCVHGDTPGALEAARAVRRALEAEGFALRPFATS